MASATGTATLNFGTHPGSNEASVVVTGQTGITGAAKADAFVMADDSTVDHTANDHKYFEVFASLSCGNPTAGSGFTIFARSTEKLTGTWAIRWVWVD